MTKAMKGRTLAESIYAEISDAMDLLDEITVEDHDADTMGQAELALTRAREMMVDKGALSLFAAAPAMLAALESIGAEIEAWADDENPDGAQSPNELAARLAIKARAAIAAATGTPTGEGGHPIPAAQQGESGQ